MLVEVLEVTDVAMPKNDNHNVNLESSDYSWVDVDDKKEVAQKMPRWTRMYKFLVYLDRVTNFWCLEVGSFTDIDKIEGG